MTEPLGDLRDEAPRVLEATAERGIEARAVGGLGVYLCCPSARNPPLAREYKDLDLVARRSAASGLEDCLGELGYTPDVEFNSLHGNRRLLFWDTRNERQLDVFIDRMVMCHTLDLQDRIPTRESTLDPADLLLAKLQVVEVNEKDLKDAAALLADHPIEGPDGLDAERIAELFAGDWGWWRTGTATLDAVVGYAEGLDDFAAAGVVRERAGELREHIEAAPKSRRWRLRAKVGERMRWYELPEEVAG